MDVTRGIEYQRGSCGNALRLMRHAVTEHRDFHLLEQDYVAAGGEIEVILGMEKNVGSEALSAWMFHEASKPNPFGLLGAMFIIEGLGSVKAAEWGKLVQRRLGLPAEAVRFLLYHGDDRRRPHGRIRHNVAAGAARPPHSAKIVKCAEVTGRLYALQIEEITAHDRT